jgi:hypothetical protein
VGREPRLGVGQFEHIFSRLQLAAARSGSHSSIHRYLMSILGYGHRVGTQTNVGIAKLQDDKVVTKEVSN